jgi:hypothetical protein
MGAAMESAAKDERLTLPQEEKKTVIIAERGSKRTKDHPLWYTKR